MIVDPHGTPLAVSMAGGNRHDVTQLAPLLDAIPRIRSRRRRPRHRPKRLFADRGYDFPKHRRALYVRGHHPEDRPPWRTARLRSGQGPLGRRANARPAAPVQTPAHPLRDTRRPRPGTPRTRLRYRLLETTTHRILK
ncbi:transposase [Streptomyces sp. NPDC050743]|uniref:transposase n=1 Tax=Streptomyces sp. NPDC050743 TaxID=3365634 RepID=UPI0037BCF1EF